MRTASVIDIEITADRVACLADAFVGPQLYHLVLDAAPQPLDEHVVPPAPLASMLMAMPLLANARGSRQERQRRALQSASFACVLLQC